MDAFVPFPLPPADPPVAVDAALQSAIQRATTELQRLELAGDMVPSLDWFIYGFVRKEAVLTSQIEGTQATLVDLLHAESQDVPRSPAVGEVCNYLEALKYARIQLSLPDGLPISVRLLCEAHRHLMEGVRGVEKRPGRVRTSQNWIGGTRPGNAAFVPPPPHVLAGVLSDLERYVHAEDALHPLVRTALLHAQFETIHPFLDGNGRLGRLLITLLLQHWGLLKQPLLYLSLYLKRHRQEYYDRLNSVRIDGDWEGWIGFFLEGVATVAGEATTTARQLFETTARDRSILLSLPSVTVHSIRLFEILPQHPIVSTSSAMDLLEITRPTAGKALSLLQAARILEEVTGKKRDRTYHYSGYLDLLRVGTEL